MSEDRTNPNHPGVYRHDGPVSDWPTCDAYMDVIEAARRVRWLLDRAAEATDKLVAEIKAAGMDTADLDGTPLRGIKSDWCLDELIKRCDDECAKFLDT